MGIEFDDWHLKGEWLLVLDGRLDADLRQLELGKRDGHGRQVEADVELSLGWRCVSLLVATVGSRLSRDEDDDEEDEGSTGRGRHVLLAADATSVDLRCNREQTSWREVERRESVLEINAANGDTSQVLKAKTAIQEMTQTEGARAREERPVSQSKTEQTA